MKKRVVYVGHIGGPFISTHDVSLVSDRGPLREAIKRQLESHELIVSDTVRGETFSLSPPYREEDFIVRDVNPSHNVSFNYAKKYDTKTTAPKKKRKSKQHHGKR